MDKEQEDECGDGLWHPPKREPKVDQARPAKKMQPIDLNYEKIGWLG